MFNPTRSPNDAIGALEWIKECRGMDWELDSFGGESPARYSCLIHTQPNPDGNVWGEGETPCLAICRAIAALKDTEAGGGANGS